MPAVRQSAATIGLLLAVGCRPPLVKLAPAPALAAVDSAAIETTVFLIGDAGHATPQDRVLGELVRQGREATRPSVIVFLGDNVYPRGVPPDTAATFPDARNRLFVQARVGEKTGLRTIFIPGNHDWERQGSAGWANVQRQGILLRKFADSTGAKVELMPGAGCPGPVVTDLGRQARLIAVDTPWWLQRGARPGREAPGARRTMMPDPDVVCPMDTEAMVLDSLRTIHRDTARRIGIMVGHHPLDTHGEHGGYHPWMQYVFPLVPTPIASWLWVPIGWIYPLGRKLVGHPQDLAGAANRAMRKAIEGTFSAESPLIYAAGHDHSLEVMRRGPGRFYLVSGSGSEDHQSAVGRGPTTAFASRRPGFIRIDVMRDGRVRLGVTTLAPDGRSQESYQAWIKE